MNPDRMGTALRLLGIGWYVVICIFGGVYGGYALDRWLDLSPLLALFGLAAGLIVAGIGTYRMLMAFLRADSNPGGESKE